MIPLISINTLKNWIDTLFVKIYISSSKEESPGYENHHNRTLSNRCGTTIEDISCFVSPIVYTFS